MLKISADICTAANMTEKAARNAHERLEKMCTGASLLEVASALDVYAKAVLDQKRWGDNREDGKARIYLAGVLLPLMYDEGMIDEIPELARFVGTTEVQFNLCTAVIKCYMRYKEKPAIPAASRTGLVDEANPTDAA